MRRRWAFLLASFSISYHTIKVLIRKSTRLIRSFTNLYAKTTLICRQHYCFPCGKFSTETVFSISFLRYIFPFFSFLFTLCIPTFSQKAQIETKEKEGKLKQHGIQTCKEFFFSKLDSSILFSASCHNLIEDTKNQITKNKKLKKSKSH